MNDFSSFPDTTNGDASKDMLAYIGLALGVFSLCAWFIPICGCPVALVAGGLSYAGLPSTQKTLAQIGIALAVIGFILTLINAIGGAILAVN